MNNGDGRNGHQHHGGGGELRVMHELIVMTPISTDNNIDHGSQLIRVERLIYDAQAPDLPNDILHVAGGQHSGIIVRKQLPSDEALASVEITDVALDFNVYLVDATAEMHKQENRQLRLWYLNDVLVTEKHHVASEFFKRLLTEFPRDYIGFVKKIMKLMQHGFKSLRKVEIEMRMVEQVTDFPAYELESSGEIQAATADHVQELLEMSYPNGMTSEQIANTLKANTEEIETFLHELRVRNIVTKLQSEQWVRVEIASNFEESIVKHLPKVSRTDQPTVAIITALYSEKLAIDAMIEDKRTYVRYKTDGESNIYTLGTIGSRRVVSTKLSSVGRHSIAAGSITTRLLGGFQDIEHVLVVGVGGGVPHFTNKERHVRLGDVVLSCAPTDDSGKVMNSAYIFCDAIRRHPTTDSIVDFSVKCWSQKDKTLVDLGKKILADQAVLESVNEESDCASNWSHIADGAMSRLSEQKEMNYQRPSADTDVLSVHLGGGNLATVAHPDRRQRSRLYLGPVGAGNLVSQRNAECRQDFAHRFHLAAFDAEFDSVVESIAGNRIDSWVLIRGIADYGDGTRNKEWQAYAALQAAAFAKLLIERLPAASFEEEAA